MKSNIKSLLSLSFLLPILLILSSNTYAKLEKATFAGGCFWCMEPPFEKLPGVISVVSGFAGGKLKNPSYKLVSSGKTEHIEVVQVTYDTSKVSYSKLLKTFWTNIDPMDKGGQFVDRGHQYSTAIFYHNESQRKLAEKSKAYIQKNVFLTKEVVTPIRIFTNFYPAEEYHQDFYKKTLFTKAKYKYYRAASGRDDFIALHWEGISIDFDLQNKTRFIKPSKDKLKKKLTELQYKVTQEDATEPPFKNKYWDNNQEGLYLDIVSGEPLFSSTHKFKSGTGWPSFTQALNKDHVVEKNDFSLFGKRIEVRSKQADSHLGHVFNDGPKPTGLRYCINSASLRFIKKEDLKEAGFEKYLSLFK